MTDDKKQQPCFVWIQFTNNDEKSYQEILDLKTSGRENHWISDLFNAEYNLLPGLNDENDVDESKPLNFTLWIEFESCSGGEKCSKTTNKFIYSAN